MLTMWLQITRTTDSDLKSSFLVSLKELLKPPKPYSEEEINKYNEIIRRLFSNLSTPMNFPDLGNEMQSVEYLVKVTDVPFEEIQKTGLKVFK